MEKASMNLLGLLLILSLAVFLPSCGGSSGGGPDLPDVDFSSESQIVAEEVGTVTVSVDLSEISSSDVTVPYTVSGTATSTSDHDLVDGDIIITAGETTGSMNFSVVDDAEVEIMETIIITMGTPTNGDKGTVDTHTVSITDSDTTDLAISIPAGSVNLNSQTTISATGGTIPYAYSIVSGGGSIDPVTGVYTSVQWPETVTFRVTDADNNTSDNAVTVAGDKMWYVGGHMDDGDVNTAVNDVWSSLNGSLWAAATALPAPRSGGSAVVYRDEIWFMGGDVIAAFSDDVYRTADGITWTIVGGGATLPENMSSFGAVVYNDEIWIMGGWGPDSGIHLIEDVYHGTDGENWTLVGAGGTMPSAGFGFSTVVYDNKIWVAGGDIGFGILDDVRYTTDGESWTNAGTLPAERTGGAMAVYNDKMWFAGGVDDGDFIVDDVYSSTDGASWTTEGTLPGDRSGGAMTVFNEKMWFIGGTDDSGLSQDNVWSSTDGIVWDSEGTLTDIRDSGCLVIFTD